MASVNNSTNSTSPNCVLPELYWKAKDASYYFTFYIFTPIYFVVAFTGHVFMLIGFLKEAKSASPYVYQVLLTVAKCIEIFFFTIFVIFYKWLSGFENAGVDWYKKNGILMWYSAHAAVPMSNSCITSSLLLAVAMSADRVFRLWKPFIYRNIDTRTHAKIAAVICFFLGWSSSAFDWFRFTVQLDGEFYVGVVNKDFVGGWTGKILANLRNALRAFGVVLLVLCNIAILYLYRTRRKQKSKITQIKMISETEKQVQREKKQNETTLIITVLSQTALITVSMSLFVGFYMAAYAWPSFSLCSGLLYACVMDFVLELADVIAFVIVVMVDKKIRDSVISAVANLRCKKQESASVTGQQTRNITVLPTVDT